MLDLGSGAGLDCFVLSRLVGEEGRVVGVDMTKEQVRLLSLKCFTYLIFFRHLVIHSHMAAMFFFHDCISSL